MRKGSGSKTQLSVTIDRKLADKLRKKVSKRMMKVSTYVEYLIARDMREK